MGRSVFESDFHSFRKENCLIMSGQKLKKLSIMIWGLKIVQITSDNIVFSLFFPGFRFKGRFAIAHSDTHERGQALQV